MFRRAFLAALAAPMGLAGCGFRPLHAPPAPGETDVAPELAAVRLGRTYGRTGQILHQALERRLAARDRSGPAARYELAVAPQLAIETQGYRRDGSPTRFRMVMSVDYTLSTLSVPVQPVAAGSARAIDSYNTIDNEYFASIVSSEEAQRRMAEQVAEDIVLRLTLALRGNPAA
ncbi:LPS assembly lipoprotein LptE [Pararoseomonas sp. SCSIO 73927]|uniref:LPS assembly lipoprotein LptE n=1 Tax=Pararoseomonas sp. SCSIO 73927 TaxID=3114537 RepID=UPI0030D3DDD6